MEFTDLFLEIIKDMILAAIAGMGFGAISNTSYNTYKYIAILAAVGHATRFLLMKYGLDIASSSFIASILIGFGSVVFGKLSYSPTTTLGIPALLPMIPGKYAYNTIYSMIMCMQHFDSTAGINKFEEMFIRNAMITSTVVFLMALGVILPVFLFPKISNSLTRKNHYK